MKKVYFLFLSVLFYLFSISLFSQIVITSQDVKCTPPLTIYFNEFLSIGPLQSLLDLNNAENQNWDFTSVSYTNNYDTTFVDSVPINSDYPEASYILPVIENTGGVKIHYFYYLKQDSTSITRLGIETDSAFIKIDTGAYIIIPHQLYDYQPQYTQMKFPLEYNPTEIDTFKSSAVAISFINVPQLLLDSINATVVEYYQLTNQTVGWGKLSLAGFSKPFDVLVLKSIEQTIDSIFFNNQLPTQSQLNLLQMTQGAVTKVINIKFFTPGIPFEVLNFTRTLSQNGNQYDSAYFYSANNPTSIDNNYLKQINNSKVIPNPVAGNSFKISFNKDSEKNWKIIIFDNTGKLILNDDVINQSGNIEVNLNFGNNRIPGNYNYLIIDGAGSVKYSGKFIVE